MKKIIKENCIEFIKTIFPKFSIYWESFIRDFGQDEGFIFQMLPFGEYIIDVIKSNDEPEIKRIFDFIEYLLHEGDDDVQTAITTGLLEHLLSKDPREIQCSKFAKYMGAESIAYCKAWDEFCGMKTQGLWDNDKKLS